MSRSCSKTNLFRDTRKQRLSKTMFVRNTFSQGAQNIYKQLCRRALLREIEFDQVLDLFDRQPCIAFTRALYEQRKIFGKKRLQKKETIIPKGFWPNLSRKTLLE